MVAVGIDIGNVYSRVAAASVHDGKLRVQVLENNEGTRRMPTCIAFAEVPLFGELAVHHIDETNVIYDLKRLVCTSGVADSHHKHLFKLASRNDGSTQVEFQWNGETTCLSSQQLLSVMICKMIDIVGKQSNAANSEGINVVIAVPDTFNDRQRQAVTEAARIAGIECVSLLNDTTAAAIAYVVRKSSGPKHNLLICDFGGGSSSISVVTVCGLDVEVLAAQSDCHLGGVDIDRLLASYFAGDKMLSPNASRLLIGACEKAKKALSSRQSTRQVIR